MKTLEITSAILMAASGPLSAATYYTTGTDLNPTNGASWNLQADGGGANGFSTTYTDATHDIIIQAGDSVTAPHTNVDQTWGANSYTLNGSLVLGRSFGTNTQTFSNGDITAGAASRIFIQSGTTTVTGTADYVLGSNTTDWVHRFGTSSGSVDFGLNTVGDGTFDFGFIASTIGSIKFSNLTSDFTGTILADRTNDVTFQFAAGDGALNANVVISRTANDRFGKLDLDGDFSLGSLSVDGDVIADGVYTYADLVALNGNYADNLIDNGGNLTVGVPEPSSTALLGLGGLALILRRRK